MDYEELAQRFPKTAADMRSPRYRRLFNAWIHRNGTPEQRQEYQDALNMRRVTNTGTGSANSVI